MDQSRVGLSYSLGLMSIRTAVQRKYGLPSGLREKRKRLGTGMRGYRNKVRRILGGVFKFLQKNAIQDYLSVSVSRWSYKMK